MTIETQAWRRARRTIARTTLALPMILAGLLVALPAAASKAAPPVYVVALPARVTFIAFLSAAGVAEAFDLDLRTEVVLPLGCGDRVAGLMRRGGPQLDGPDAYDVVVERRAAGECKKKATRIGARFTVRMRIPDGAVRELVLGQDVHRVARRGVTLTLDDQGPEGDLPGAPPTAPPITLVTGEVKDAALRSVEPIDGSGGAGSGALVGSFEVRARWPRCAREPIGLLGHGDLTSRFQLDRFVPLAPAPLDGSCGRAEVERRSLVQATMRLGRGVKRLAIAIGAQRLELAPPGGAAP